MFDSNKTSFSRCNKNLKKIIRIKDVNKIYSAYVEKLLTNL